MEQLHWFLDPVKHHYFDFEGRVTRQQYWMFILWTFIISIPLSVIGSMIDVEGLDSLFSLAIFLPSLGLATRRLHDIDKSGWWQLLFFIPIIGWIVVIVWLAQVGRKGTNRYGVDPKTTDVAPQTPPTPQAISNPVTTATAEETTEKAPSEESRM